jgi:hypothetical protein
MTYPFNTNQQPDLPPFETLAFAGGGGNPTQGNGRIGTDSDYRTLRDTDNMDAAWISSANDVNWRQAA